jgi:hypothetical protein
MGLENGAWRISRGYVMGFRDLLIRIGVGWDLGI